MLTCIVGEKQINCFDGTYDKTRLKIWSDKNLLKCSDCGGFYEYCHGEIVPPYFRHKDKNEDCEGLYSEPETAEHLNGKLLLYRWLLNLQNQGLIQNLRLEVYITETKQRPDIYFEKDNKKYVMEFQCSPISSEYMLRHDLYRLNNIHDIWILGMNNYSISQNNIVLLLYNGVRAREIRTKTIEREILNFDNILNYLDVENEVIYQTDIDKKYSDERKTIFDFDYLSNKLNVCTLENILDKCTLKSELFWFEERLGIGKNIILSWLNYQDCVEDIDIIRVDKGISINFKIDKRQYIVIYSLNAMLEFAYYSRNFMIGKKDSTLKGNTIVIYLFDSLIDKYPKNTYGFNICNKKILINNLNNENRSNQDDWYDINDVFITNDKLETNETSYNTFKENIQNIIDLKEKDYDLLIKRQKYALNILEQARIEYEEEQRFINSKGDILGEKFDEIKFYGTCYKLEEQSRKVIAFFTDERGNEIRFVNSKYDIKKEKEIIKNIPINTPLTITGRIIDIKVIDNCKVTTLEIVYDYNTLKNYYINILDRFNNIKINFIDSNMSLAECDICLYQFKFNYLVNICCKTYYEIDNIINCLVNGKETVNILINKTIEGQSISNKKRKYWLNLFNYIGFTDVNFI
jgi:hypothetical protein